MFAVNSICKCYNHLFNACINGSKSIFKFGYHSSGNSSVFDIFVEIRTCDNWNNAVVIVCIAEYTFLFEAIDKCNIV